MRYCLLLLLAGFLSSCGNGEQQNTEDSDATAPESMVQPETSEPVLVNEEGKKVYDQYCVVCHQVDGSGVPNAFPPLNQTEYVNGDTNRLIGIVLNGLNGEIEVKGVTYNGVMVAHDFLSDQEVADVITYVRSSFGNDAPAVTAEQVAQVRAQAQ